MKKYTEEELLEIAKEVEKLNECNLEGLKLTGSLMLYVRGLDKNRDASDIDFICDSIYEDGEGFPLVPNGFYLNNQEGYKSTVECTQFINEDGIKIEFMVSEENHKDVIDGITCATVQGMIYAKLLYIKNDKYSDSRIKHLDDLLYLLEYNELI